MSEKSETTDPIVDAQHDETGRMWRGPLSQLPGRFSVVPVAELQALRAENARLREALQHAEAAMDSLMSDEMPYTESCRIWRTAAESIRAALEVKP
jgi:hypothetical protein